MQKEKRVKSYTRRTKSGKMVTVKAHTAKYDAADMAKEALKKKGAGGELEKRYESRTLKETDQDKAAKLREVVAKLEKAKASDAVKAKSASKADSTSKKQPVGSGSTGRVKKDTTTKKSTPNKSVDSTKISATDFRTWYHEPDSLAGQQVAKKLKKQLSSDGYKRLDHAANESYSKRGHTSLFKSLETFASKKTPAGAGSTGRTKKKPVETYTDTLVNAAKSLAVSDNKGKPDKKARSLLMKAGYLRAVGHGDVWFKDIHELPRNKQTILRKLIDTYNKNELPHAKTPVGSGSTSKKKSVGTGTTGLRKKDTVVTKTKSPDLSTRSGQMSYIRSRVKELPEESRKRLNPLLRIASIGVISTTDLWRKYQREKYPKNNRQWSMPTPWDKRAWSDMAHSD